MSETAVVLTNGLFQTVFAKTAHGLVRGPSRYRILGLVDAAGAGRDAGDLLDGRPRGIPVFEDLATALRDIREGVSHCVVGVATVGGVMPPAVRQDLMEAAAAGISLVNGLHQLLADDEELTSIANRSGARIIDLRRPRPVRELRFWSGEVLALDTPRVAVLGTDCAVGKRTTASLLLAACRERGLATELIYTGQTGWLQGFRHGFILDATPNDFVCGELERAILDCEQETGPDLMLIEGQAALRHPAGPCGSELILGGGANGVILQHVPGRRYFEDLEEQRCEIPSLEEEIRLIRLLGGEVWGVTLNGRGLGEEELCESRDRLRGELGLPVVLPLLEGVGELAEELEGRLGRGSAA
jgi:uncharacterized NAD-dependent epimerase/dehydratase family protein